MKTVTLAVLAIMTVFLLSACSQKKVSTVDQSSAPASQQQTKPADTQQTAPTKKILTEKVTSLDTEKDGPIPPYVKELQSKLTDAYFAYDKYDLSEEARKSVGMLAEILSKNRKVKVTIEGHCDERGTNEYNLALGDRRARAAGEYLVSLGIQSGRISSMSYGEEKPACSESSESCWAKNRRAHFHLSE